MPNRLSTYLEKIGLNPVTIALVFGVILLFVNIRLRMSTAIGEHLNKLLELQDVSMKQAISLALLAASIYIILSSRFGPKDKHWAYGTVGTLLGYWLKP
jgi:ABC-type sulfate transport system permease subunit